MQNPWLTSNLAKLSQQVLDWTKLSELSSWAKPKYLHFPATFQLRNGHLSGSKVFSGEKSIQPNNSTIFDKDDNQTRGLSSHTRNTVFFKQIDTYLAVQITSN